MKLSYKDTLFETSSRHRSLDEIIQDIKTGVYKDLVDEIRDSKNKEQADKLKKQLPTFFVDVVLDGSAKSISISKSVSSTGIIQFDLDEYDLEKSKKTVVKNENNIFGMGVQHLRWNQLRGFLKQDEFDAICKEADLILAPVTPTTAFAFDSKKSPLEMYLEDIYTISVNLAGLPAISVPIGNDSAGMPIGMQLIANSFEEQTLFDGASAVEAMLK